MVVFPGFIFQFLFLYYSVARSVLQSFTLRGCLHQQQLKAGPVACKTKRQQWCPAEMARLAHSLLGASAAKDAAKGLLRPSLFVLGKKDSRIGAEVKPSFQPAAIFSDTFCVFASLTTDLGWSLLVGNIWSSARFLSPSPLFFNIVVLHCDYSSFSQKWQAAKDWSNYLQTLKIESRFIGRKQICLVINP